jgi:hypothetical protein
MKKVPAMKKQTRRKTPRKPRRALTQRKELYDQVVEFPQAKGRTVELVELIVDADYQCISIRFADKTDLTVVIDPGLRFKAEFSDWKNQEQRVIKSWPTVRSEGM